jgi:serine/threonine protein phosphatase PrpC
MIFGSMLAKNWGLFNQFPTIDTGHLEPFYKQKENFDKVTEDALSTSWNSILVADGVGGNDFPSLGIAQALVTEVNLELATQTEEITSKSEFERIISEKIVKVIDKYEGFVKDIVKNTEGINILKNKENLNDNEFDNYVIDKFQVSTTFIAAHITKVLDNKPTLSIFQKGDSSVIVLREVLVKASPESYYFRPIYVSRPMEFRFNTPFSYAAFVDDKKPHFTKHIAIEKGDLVIVCSDGVADNLSVTYITYLINYLLQLQLKGPITKEQYMKLITKLNTKLIDSVKADRENIQNASYDMLENHKKISTTELSIFEMIQKFLTEKLSICNEGSEDDNMDF